jgi:hypothetical protein
MLVVKDMWSITRFKTTLRIVSSRWGATLDMRLLEVPVRRRRLMSDKWRFL